MQTHRSQAHAIYTHTLSSSTLKLVDKQPQRKYVRDEFGKKRERAKYKEPRECVTRLAEVWMEYHIAKAGLEENLRMC